MMTDVLYLPEGVDWIKFNVDMSGYYIVHYEGSGWDDLIALLHHNHTALSSNDRASLINNAFQLVRLATYLDICALFGQWFLGSQIHYKETALPHKALCLSCIVLYLTLTSQTRINLDS